MSAKSGLQFDRRQFCTTSKPPGRRSTSAMSLITARPIARNLRRTPISSPSFTDCTGLPEASTYSRTTSSPFLISSRGRSRSNPDSSTTQYAFSSVLFVNRSRTASILKVERGIKVGGMAMARVRPSRNTSLAVKLRGGCFSATRSYASNARIAWAEE